MAIYFWCKICQTRESACKDPIEHKAKGFFQYRTDFMLGGRTGTRLRKIFERKKDAEDYQRTTITDYKRGDYTLSIKKKDKIFFQDFADRYYTEHCLIVNRHPERATKSKITVAKLLLGKRPLSDITRTELKELQQQLPKKRNWKASAVNRFFNVLKAIFYKAMEWEILDKNPAEFIIKLVEDDPIPRFLTQKEINLLRSKAIDQRLQDYITVLLHTGMRPSFIKEMGWDVVDLTNRVIHAMNYKGRKPHRYPVPIDDSLYELLLRRASLTKKLGLVFDTSNINSLVKQAIKETRLNEGKSKEQRFTIYGLKHCYASHLLMSGVSLATVTELLGNTDMRMTKKHYGHLTIEYLREAQNKVNLTPDNLPRPSTGEERELAEGGVIYE